MSTTLQQLFYSGRDLLRHVTQDTTTRTPGVVKVVIDPKQHSQADIKVYGVSGKHGGVEYKRICIYKQSYSHLYTENPWCGSTLLFQWIPTLSLGDNVEYIYMGILHEDNIGIRNRRITLDPGNMPSYLALHGDPILCFAATHYGMHMGQPRDQHVMPHIIHQGLSVHCKSPHECLVDWMRRLGHRNTGDLQIHVAGKLSAVNMTRLIDWVRHHEIQSIIPGEASLHDMLLRTQLSYSQTQPVPVLRATRKRGVMSEPSLRTAYKGNTYASRLEAKWAMLFDILEIRFTYESILMGSQRMGAMLGNGAGRYYKPDMWLVGCQVAIEIKPSPPSRQERILCAEFTRSSGIPIIILYGSMFTYPTTMIRVYSDERPKPGPHGILFTYDTSCISDVRAETVYIGRVSDTDTWGFHNIVDLDHAMLDKDIGILQDAHARVEQHPWKC